MSQSTKILTAASVIAFLSFLQIGAAQQLVDDGSNFALYLRSPILVGMAVVQLIFAFWALADVTKKIDEEKPAPAKRRTRHAR